MLKTDFQQSYYDGEQQQQHQPTSQLPDHLKCGEVYTWLCAGEIYAVECKLCTDNPLCPLSEFPQHMEIWHTEWEEETDAKTHANGSANYFSGESKEEIQFAKEDNNEILNNDRVVAFTTEIHNQLHNTRNARTQTQHEALLEPFEQVLIEQDPAIDTTIHISEEVNEEEYFRDVNEQVAAAAPVSLHIENKQSEILTFAKQNLQLANKEPGEKIITVKESKLQHLTDTTKPKGKSVICCPAENFINESKYLNKEIQSNIENEIESQTSETETNYINYFKKKKNIKKFKPETKFILQKCTKLNEIKRALNRIIKDICDKGTDEWESETSATSANEDYNRNPQLKQNFVNSTGSEASLIENERNALNKNYHVETKKENKRNYLKKFAFKTNKKYFKKFKNSGTAKQTLSERNKKQSKQNVITFNTSLEAGLEYKAGKQSENGTLGESIAQIVKSSKNTTKINENQNIVVESIKKLKNTKRNSKDTKWKNKQTRVIADVKELHENESEINGNKVYFSESEVELNKSETDKITYQEEQFENSMEQCGNETAVNKNRAENVRNKINLLKQEKINANEHYTGKIERIVSETIGSETIGSETIGSEITTKSFMNELPSATNKLRSTESKASNKKPSSTGTNENETIKSNLAKCLKKSSDLKIQPTKYLTRQWTTKRAEPNGNETLFGQKPKKINCIKKEKNKNGKLLDTINGQNNIHMQAPSGNETKKSNYFKCLQNRDIGENFSKTILRSKAKSDQAETNEFETLERIDDKEKIKCKALQNEDEAEYIFSVLGTQGNETHNRITRQGIRKSQRTKRSVENFVKIYPRREIKDKSEGTNEIELLKNETLLKTFSVFQSTIANGIVCEKMFESENSKRMNETEPLESNNKIKQNTYKPEDSQIEIFISENNVKECNESGSKNKTIRLGKPGKILKKYTRKQNINKSDILSNKSAEETNGSETLANYNKETEPYENEKATDGIETLCDKMGKSLRNIRKDNNNIENYLQLDEHYVKNKAINGIQKNPCGKKNKNGRNFTKHLKLKTNDLIISENNKILAINENKTLEKYKDPEKYDFITSENDIKMKTDDPENSGKYGITESNGRFKKSTAKSKRIVRKRLEQEKNGLKARLRNGSDISRAKRQLHFRSKNLTKKNRKSNAKRTSLANLKRSRKICKRKTSCAENKQGAPDSAKSGLLCEISDYTQSREICVLGRIPEKKLEEQNYFPNCEEISLPAKEKDQTNVLAQQNRKEVSHVQAIETKEEGSMETIVATVYGENNTSAQETDEIIMFDERDIIAVCRENNVQAKESNYEGMESIMNTVKGKNSTSAQESDENNVFDQRAIKTICQENNDPATNSYEQQTQYCNEHQKENLTEKQLNSLQRDNCPVSDTILNSITQYAAAIPITKPNSPLSPKTEEEHFEFYEPKEKLHKEHISHLIKLYQEHSRLWDQSHPDFCEPQLCRKSWQKITEEWNKYCQRKFTVAEVRIRICTLCQRFVQEKNRLALEGELDECAKFPYYEQMKFLEHQKSLRKRRELYEQQNEKILEIYQYFPILWHVRHYKSRLAQRRAEAFESISKVLKLFGLHLSSLGVQKRIRSLRKCYRLEKIRHLHAQVEQTTFHAEFSHYERMKFMDKHIDPFVCHICGKIFQNLQGFREHLEAENHGSISQQDIDMENIFDKEEQEENGEKYLEYSVTGSERESFTESENSTDILQRFTPFPSATQSFLNNYPQNLECFSLNTTNEPLINTWPFEDQVIEEIMETVNHNNSFSQHGLDQFINSVTSCEELTNGNSLFEEVLSPSILTADNSFIVEQPVIISDQTCPLLSPLSNAESLISVDYAPENSLSVEHSNPDHNLNVLRKAKGAGGLATKGNDMQPLKELADQVTAEVIKEQSSSPTAVLIKVQCSDYSVNLKLNTQPLSTLNSALPDSDPELYSSGDNSTTPLADHLIRKMIELYRKFPQLWDPNHLDFNSRTLRRQAWVNLAIEFNSIVGKQLSWRTLHRKLTDYAKYYKKLITDQAKYENLINKWIFYEDFKFLDDVIAVNAELQRSVHHRDNNFKIISTYNSFPQLWNIKHPEFSKRSCKQRNIELMCSKLQEENNLQLTTERLKNRLIELRAQYRSAKKQRLKCLKNQQKFSASEFEFYEALNFLDDHIDPFVCDKCKMEFKKLTDYNQHLKKEHAAKKRIILPPAEPGMENVCHICGIKFTTRSNLLHHIKRHEGIRNYACTMCPKKFYASHALKIHIRSHTKECPYTCEKCGMSFVSASKLNQHVKRHLNQKDYECSYCLKTFFTAFEKDRHERRHLNIRDKVCTICGKTFVAGSSYYTHLMLHNDTKRFECDKCDMKFAQYPGLFKHKKRYHT